jgi:S-adenosylmethionine decarboxylase
MNDNRYQPYGRHVLADISNADFDALNDAHKLEQAMVQAALAEGVAVLGTMKKLFTPCGVTVLLLLAESHVSLHTYPDQGKAFFDAFTCGDSFHPANIFTRFAALALPGQYHVNQLERGWPASAIPELQHS